MDGSEGERRMERAAQGREMAKGPEEGEGKGPRRGGVSVRTFGERAHRRLALLLQLTDVAIKNSADAHAWNPYMRMIREGKPHLPLNQVNFVQGGLRVSGPVAPVGWEEPEAPSETSLRSLVEAMDVEARKLFDDLFSDIPAAPAGSPDQDPWERKQDLMLRAIGYLVYRAPAMTMP
ncbi:MAG TPA: hypothetical protein VNM87_01850 [Candidatus Udaeobacter sp.]|nr:hypothetical protein [Candidatus Udaeobacter sp.]